MLSVTNLRAGDAFLHQSKPYQVLKYKHSYIARGSAKVKLKLRNLSDGTVIEKTFQSGAEVQPVSVFTKKVQFLYQDDSRYFFMNPKTFQQFSVSKKILGNKSKFLKEGKTYRLLFWTGKESSEEPEPLSLDLPASLDFEVVQTPPGVKGDSATSVRKKAVLENGLEVKVPLFINKGDVVSVDTRTEEYLERVEKG